jgi:hypothetical protein
MRRMSMTLLNPIGGKTTANNTITFERDNAFALAA